MIKTPVQLRWNDMDMLGHLYNGKYQSVFDVGMSEYLSGVLGLSYTPDSGGLWPLKVSTTLNYLQQVTYKYPLEVHTFGVSVGNKSLTVRQDLVRADTGEKMADSTTVLVCYDLGAKVSAQVPEQWRLIIEQESLEVLE